MARLHPIVVLTALAAVMACASAASAQAPPPLPVAAPVGQVEKIEDGILFIGIGRQDGAQPGDSVEIATREGSVVVRVTVVEDERLRAVGPFGVLVEVGAAARLTAASPTAGRALPGRPSYFGLEGRLFGLASLSERNGGGVFGDFVARYRAKVPVAVHLRLAPIGVGAGSGSETLGFGHGEVGFSFDHRVFELGVSLGASYADIDSFGRGTFDGIGVSTGAFMRVGARDGIFVETGVSYVRTDERFVWVLLRFEAMIPLAHRYWLSLRAAGGQVRGGMGAVGLRYRMRGWGGPGTLFLSFHLGGAGIFRPDDSDVFAGPLLGVGVERRF